MNSRTIVDYVSGILDDLRSKDSSIPDEDILEFANFLKTAYFPKKMSEANSNWLYKLSESHYVLLRDTSGIKILCLSNEPQSISNPRTSKTDVIKQYQGGTLFYDNRKCSDDIRDGLLPEVDVLKYNCGCSDECLCKFTNLPRSLLGDGIFIWNNSTSGISLTRSQYEEYTLAPPDAIFGHRYVNNNGSINYKSYCSDRKLEPTYWFTIDEGNIAITDSKSGIPLLENIVKNIKNAKSAAYYPERLDLKKVDEVSSIMNKLGLGLMTHIIH